MALRIKPVCVGTSQVDKSILTYLRGQGTKLTVPHIIWLIEGGQKLAVVDTGPAAPEIISRELGRNLTRKADEEPAQALKNAGVDPSAVEILIATHLHWDHCGNFSLFPNADIYVQRRELAFAAAPLDIYLGVYDSAIIDMNPKWSGSVSRFRIVDGDFELAAGVKLLSLPGHTPGLQGVLVSTGNGNYCIPSDTVNIAENWADKIPSGIHVNLEDWYRSFRKIEKMADHVLPCHEMTVLDRPEYP